MLSTVQFIVNFFLPDSDEMVRQAAVYFGALTGMGVGFFLMQCAGGYSSAAAGEPFIRRLRRSAFVSIVSQSVGFLEQPGNAPGALAARLGVDGLKLKQALGPKLGDKIAAITTLIAGLVVAFIACWPLALIVLAAGPFVAWAMDAENKLSFGLEGEVKSAYAEAGGISNDAVAAIRVVHAFGLHQAVLTKFERALATPYKASYWRALGLAIGYGASQFTQNVIAAIVFKAGLWLMSEHPSLGVSGEGIIGTFMAFQLSLYGCAQLVALFGDLAQIRDALRGFFSIILRPTDLDGSEAAVRRWQPTSSLEDAARLAMPAGRIEFRDVRFSYPTRPDVPVLRGLNLTIEPGQTVALVGPSGSGKSRVCQLLLGFYPLGSDDAGAEATAVAVSTDGISAFSSSDKTSDSSSSRGGCILLDGVDVSLLPARAVRDACGWVPQEAPLFADSVAYNIAYGRSGGAFRKPAPDRGMPRDVAPDAPLPAGWSVPADVSAAAAAANAAGFIEGFKHGYATHVGEGGRGISGGQKQRVAIARAIIRNPSCLILDESTSALDSESERICQASIDALLQQQRASGRSMSTIIVAHRLSSIVHADKIVVLDAGVAVEEGSFAELLGREGGLFARLAHAQGLGLGLQAPQLQAAAEGLGLL